MRFQVVPLGKEHSTQAESKHLHTINVDQQITVMFQLLKQCETKFILRGDTFEVRKIRKCYEQEKGPLIKLGGILILGILQTLEEREVSE